MTLLVNNAGTWARPKKMHVKDNGAWHEVKRTWIKDGGVWKVAFPYDPLVNSSIVSATGITDIPVPKHGAYYPDRILITHYGGWGQSGEDGILWLFGPTIDTNNPLAKLREGAAIINPPGCSTYQVFADGTTSLLTSFGNQAQTKHTTYWEIHCANQPFTTFRSDGAPANVSNPTTFTNASVAVGFVDRATILATLATNTNDRYYLTTI